MSFGGMFGYRMKDQLSLSNASDFIGDQDSLDNLIFFVNEVQFKQGIREYDEYVFRAAEKAFAKGADLYGVKIIRPLRILLLRLLKENYGFVQLHASFLVLCKRYSVPKEALPILEYPGYFKHATKAAISQFLIYGCDLLITLKKYNEAIELVNRGFQMEFMDYEIEMALIKRYVVLSIALGMPTEDKIKDKIQNMANIEGRMISQLHEERDIEEIRIRQGIYQFFYDLSEDTTLTPDQELMLKVEGLLQLFQSSKGAKLGSYIKENIMMNNWRIKAAEVSGQKLDDLQVIKGVNLSEEIYRYDCKNKIMYFNHKEANQEKLNTMITKAFNMSEEVTGCRIERRETGGMGGMGMGGMGGMGRMGGMGGMGGMGDMGRGLRRRQM